MASKAPTIKAKDLAPKCGSVKGGSRGENLNDNMTLVRNQAAKKTKDLQPRSSSVKGGGKRLNDNVTLVRAAKDLAPKSTGKVQGGRAGWTNNENITLVRAAKPTRTQKDLPSCKDVTGGKKQA